MEVAPDRLGVGIALKSLVRTTIVGLSDGGAAVRELCTSGSRSSGVASSPVGSWVLPLPCGKRTFCDLRLGEITR